MRTDPCGPASDQRVRVGRFGAPARNGGVYRIGAAAFAAWSDRQVPCHRRRDLRGDVGRGAVHGSRRFDEAVCIDDYGSFGCDRSEHVGNAAVAAESRSSAGRVGASDSRSENETGGAGRYCTLTCVVLRSRMDLRSWRRRRHVRRVRHSRRGAASAPDLAKGLRLRGVDRSVRRRSAPRRR